MDTIREIIHYIRGSKKSTALITVTAILLVFGTVIASQSSTDVDEIDLEGNRSLYINNAYLANGNEIYDEINNSDRVYEQITRDLSTFAKKAYSTYRDETGRIVVFSLNKNSIKKEANEVSFEGKFGSSPNLVKVSAELLDNERLKNSIIDTKTSLQMDDLLPSNSNVNKFVATLPIIKPGYNIYYSRESDYLIRVDIGTQSAAVKDEALAFLVQNTDKNFVDDFNIEIYFLTSSIDGERTEYIPTYISDFTSPI